MVELTIINMEGIMRFRSTMYLLAISLTFAYSQGKVINLDAKLNALLLTASNSKMINGLSQNQAYTISVTANSVNAPMQGAFFVMQNKAGYVESRFLKAGESFVFVPINNTYQMSAFYVDWSTTADNSGSLTVTVTGATTQTYTIDAKSNAILLDNVTPIVNGLSSSIDYVVSIKDSALSGILTTGVFVMYQESNSNVGFRYVPVGESFIFRPIATNYQIAALFVDWADLSDNKGKVKIEITPKGAIEKTVRLDAKNDALLLTASNAKMVNNLTPNQPYTISVSANNVFAPMQGLFLVMQNKAGYVESRYVHAGESFMYSPINSSYQLAAFYVDWSTLNDNSGSLTLNISGPTTQSIVVDAKTNAILLDNVTPIISGLTSSSNKEYVISVRDSALSGVLNNGLFFMYQDITSKVGFRYVPAGSAF
ncbi:MAG: hypothetical protein HUU02_15015, partial [Bacteroidetes bacterium]|nr:hypothetical protein [Bacteroidota bacterium]